MKTKQTPFVPIERQRLVQKVVAVIGLALLGTFAASAGQGPQPGICIRSCWGARAPQCGISQMASLTRAIIHHTGGAGEYSTNYETSKSKCRSNQAYVMDSLGYCDADYHFYIDGAGNVFEGRSGSMGSLPRGSHDGCNANSFGFATLGYFHPPYNNPFTSACRNSLEAVIAWRMPSSWSATGSGTYCSGTVGTLDGHYKVKSTACPGDGIIPSIPGIRTGVMNRKNGVATPSYVPNDFTGNSRSDYVLYTPSTGGWKVRDSAGSGAVTSFTVVAAQSGDVPLIGNWSGPTVAEAAVFRPSTGTWYTRFANGSVGSVANWGQAGDIPLIGAWSGQMRDQALFRASTGTWYIRFGDTGATTSVPQWGQAGDVPLVGNFSGGGMVDQVLFRASGGAWFVRNGSTGSTSYFTNWGQAGDIPLIGAWSGQMRDATLFRPSNGTWYIRFGSTGATTSMQFGLSGDMPMVGNVFGNGIVDQILFRPSTGGWFVRDGTSGAVYTFAFGSNGDQLVRQ